MVCLRTSVTGVGVAALAMALLSIPILAVAPVEAAPARAPLLGPNTSTSGGGARVVQHSYIVVLKDGSAVPSAASRATAMGGSVGSRFTHVLNGYSVTLTSPQLDRVRQDPAVKYVQPNMFHSAGPAPSGARAVTEPDTTLGKTETNAPWGLDRVDQRNLPLGGTYYLTADGSRRSRTVRAFVVDTGIYAQHPDFRRRVLPGADEIGNTNGTVDCNGHGTHVAGTLGGYHYGIAKDVALIPVRVLNCAGYGTDAQILAGLEWIRTRPADDAALGPGVVNMSLEGDLDQALNDAVQQLVDSGIPVVVAAGNGPNQGRGVNACTQSPASAPAAITVAASTSTDRAATFSNYGPCVDLYAPGQTIESDVPGKQDGQFWVATASGTSMAAPHVSGTVAMYMETHPDATPAQITAAITATASTNKITGVNPQFPHSLLFALQPMPLAGPVTGGNSLAVHQSLPRGVRLYSSNGKYFLAHRSRDGWLCLYDATTGKVIWSSGRSGAGTTMETYGYLMTYDNYGRGTWYTPYVHSSASMRPALIVNDKGYLMIKQTLGAGKVIWSTPH